MAACAMLRFNGIGLFALNESEKDPVLSPPRPESAPRADLPPAPVPLLPPSLSTTVARGLYAIATVDFLALAPGEPGEAAAVVVFRAMFLMKIERFASRALAARVFCAFALQYSLLLRFVSVSTFDERGATVIFQNGTCTVVAEGKTFVFGEKVGKLYRVRTSVEVCNFGQSETPSKNSLELWHLRFGHLNIPDVKKLSGVDCILSYSKQSMIRVNIPKVHERPTPAL